MHFSGTEVCSVMQRCTVQSTWRVSHCTDCDAVNGVVSELDGNNGQELCIPLEWHSV